MTYDYNMVGCLNFFIEIALINLGLKSFSFRIGMIYSSVLSLDSYEIIEYIFIN